MYIYIYLYLFMCVYVYVCIYKHNLTAFPVIKNIKFQNQLTSSTCSL